MLTCSYADRREILEFVHHIGMPNKGGMIRVGLTFDCGEHDQLWRRER